MTAKLRIFVSSVQKELEDERAIVQNLVNTDAFLSAHCVPVLYEFEPASPRDALEGCLKALDACDVYVLIVGVEYGTLVGDVSITRAEYRRAKERSGRSARGACECGRSSPVRGRRPQDHPGDLRRSGGDSESGLPPGPITLARLRSGRYRPCSRNPLLAQSLSYFHRIEERGSGFRRMRDQMLDHGLDPPVLSTDMGYFEVMFPGPADNIERIRVPQTQIRVTPAIEARLNERQQKIMRWLVEGMEVTSRACEAEFGVTRPTAASDIRTLVELGLAERIGAGRSTRYRFREREESLSNRQAEGANRKVAGTVAGVKGGSA